MHPGLVAARRFSSRAYVARTAGPRRSNALGPRTRAHWDDTSKTVRRRRHPWPAWGRRSTRRRRPRGRELSPSCWDVQFQLHTL